MNGWRRVRAAVEKALPHVLALACCAALAIWLTFPLIVNLGSAIPGDGPGDNVCFLWNTWWFRRCLSQPFCWLWTEFIFAPPGTSLILHTHTLLQVLLGTLVMPGATTVVAHNGMLLLGLSANGALAYALGYYYSGRMLPSLAGSLTFAWSDYVVSRSLGHINLAHAWVLPLFALSFARWLASPTVGRASMVGAVLALVAYSDYYYGLYCFLFAAIGWASLSFRVVVSRRLEVHRRALLVCVGAAAVLGLAAIVVALSGGGVFNVAGTRVSITSTRNIEFAISLLLATAFLLKYQVGLSRAERGVTAIPPSRQWVMAAACFVLLVSPLMTTFAVFVGGGNYVEPPVLWRSSPSGIDVSTLVMGPAHHVLTGGWTKAQYDVFGIDVIEQSGWLGVLPVLAIAIAAFQRRKASEVRMWLSVAAVFFVLSLGPFVRILGTTTGVILPDAVLRYIPVISNARMPGRAIVMVQLSAAMLTVFALRRRQGPVLVAWPLALAFELWPAPTPLYQLPRGDRVDSELRRSTIVGSVLELPTGLRDGFGELGRLDHRLLVHQLVHERPVVGGFAARLSLKTRRSYMRSPFLVSALEISGAPPAVGSCPLTVHGAHSAGIAYLVVNRDRIPRKGACSRKALVSAGFRFIVIDGPRELYATR